MKPKKLFYTELAWAAGLLILALGTAFMERADLGMSMVVAPAYLLHRKISQVFPAYSFGMSEYVFQAVLLIVLGICLRRFKKSFLFSFVTAVIYGFTLDLAMGAVGLLPFSGPVWRGVFYLLGLAVCALGVSLLFHTYLPPEAYELFVKEISARLGTDIHKTKTVYDCVSCLIGLALSFLFFGFGHFEGVKLGTIFCALVNGWLIGQASRALERRFRFEDALPWRERFSR